MPLPPSLKRLNRRLGSGPLLAVCAWLPTLGVLGHVGRRTGRRYRTPVNVFGSDGTYTIALTYGRGTDWVKNVLAAGGCDLETLGRHIRITRASIMTDGSRRVVPAPWRLLFKLIAVDEFMQLSG